MKIERQRRTGNGDWEMFLDDMTTQEEVEWRQKEIEAITQELLQFMLQKVTLELGISEGKSIPTDEQALAWINQIWGIKADRRKQLWEEIQNLSQ